MEDLLQLSNGLAAKLRDYDELSANLKLLRFRLKIREDILEPELPRFELEKEDIRASIRFLEKLVANAEKTLLSDHNQVDIESLRHKLVEARVAIDSHNENLAETIRGSISTPVQLFNDLGGNNE